MLLLCHRLQGVKSHRQWQLTWINLMYKGSETIDPFALNLCVANDFLLTRIERISTFVECIEPDHMDI